MIQHQRRAYTAVTARGGGFELGLAFEGGSGYVAAELGRWEDYKTCQEQANNLNREIHGLSTVEAFKIVASSMRPG